MKTIYNFNFLIKYYSWLLKNRYICVHKYTENYIKLTGKGMSLGTANERNGNENLREGPRFLKQWRGLG